MRHERDSGADTSESPAPAAGETAGDAGTNGTNGADGAGRGDRARSLAGATARGTGRAARATARGSRAAALASARGVRRAGSASGRAAGFTLRQARRASHAEGAGDSGLFRLIELHAVNAAGDAAVALSLAGTLFFQVPTAQARGQVALFLGLTMLPFAIVAPLIGPFLDRFSHGRRWAIGATMALRAFLCWVLADAVSGKSIAMFPAALGCLVASKAYGVTRTAAVPRLLPPGFSLVNANSRSALAGVAGMAIGGGLAGAVAKVGPQWSLRLAFAIYVVGTVLAIRLPGRVDSGAGERDLAAVESPRPPRAGSQSSRARRWRDRVAALPDAVLVSQCCAVGARLLTGFLTLFMAFLMREHPIPGYSGTLVLALVVGAAGAGNALGTVLGNALRRRRPDLIISVALLCD
ncbi:MAG: MFS transporter, partial [Nocardioidaceae bacterium]